MLKSKLHRARVTGASLDYEGSLTIASDLMERVGLVAYEKILCGNMANGARWETYAIPGKPGSGQIELNGAVARLGQVGDLLTIMSFCLVDHRSTQDWKPRVVRLNEFNDVVDQTPVDPA